MNKWLVNAVVATSALSHMYTHAAEFERNEILDTSTKNLNLDDDSFVVEQTMSLGGSKLKDRLSVIDTMSKGGSKLRDRMNIASTMLLGGSKLRDYKIRVDQIGDLTTVEEKMIIINSFLKNEKDNSEVIEGLRLMIDKLSN